MIGLYCPDVPPIPGGVADHTLVLARALEVLGHPPAVLARRGDPGRFTPLPCRTGLTPLGLWRAVRDLNVSALLVQYVPFLFARRGVAPSLCWGLSRVASAGVPVAVFVHEPFVPFTRLPWLVTGLPMRWQLRCILRRAAIVYAPVPRFVEIARRYARASRPVRLAPVGATLPSSAATRAEARRALGLANGTVAIGVFSPAASGFLLEWVDRARAALAGRRDVVLVSFGFGSERLPASAPTGAPLMRVTDHDAVTVAQTMRALDLAMAPYVDGLTMRRTAAMLALAHGIPVVSSTGQLFDPKMAELAVCESSAGAFADRVARLVDGHADRADAARSAARYGATASVEALARLLVADLGGGPQ